MQNYIPIFASEDAPIETAVDRARPDNLISHFFDERLLKAMFLHALRVDIPNNNIKASILKQMLSRDFIELGTGTNRITFQHNDVVCKIALDRRGMVDNYTEWKRSQETPEFLAKTYETNLLIDISECISPISQSDFFAHEQEAKTILKYFSQGYLFNDIGFTLKNFGNWGIRKTVDISQQSVDLEMMLDEATDAGDTKTAKKIERKLKRLSKLEEDDGELVILDYGYMYPLAGQSQDLFKCPHCGSKIEWDSGFTKFVCGNAGCRIEYSVVEIWHRMDMSVQESEDKVIQKINGLGNIDFHRLESALSDIMLS